MTQRLLRTIRVSGPPFLGHPAVGVVTACVILLAGPGVPGIALGQHPDGDGTDRSAGSVQWRPFEEALTVADTTGRPVLVDVEAPWCGWCRKMDREVYPQLASFIDVRLVATRLNREDRTATHRYRGARYTEAELARELKASGVPTVVLLDADGNYLFHVSGFHPASALRLVLSYAAEGAYRSQSLRSYLRER